MQVNTNLDPWLTNMRDNCVFLETAVLNTMDKTIIFTVLSGNVRELFAVIQGVAFLSLALYYTHAAITETGMKRAMMQDNVWFCLDMTKHAFLNYGRAQIASYTGVSQVITATVLIIYDWGLQDRQRYIGENENPVKNYKIMGYA